MIKELRKDNNKIFEVQVSSQSETQQKNFGKDNSQISTKKQAINLRLQKMNNAAKINESQAQISVRTANIAKLTFMDQQQSDQSSPQVDEHILNYQLNMRQELKIKNETKNRQKLQTHIVKQTRNQKQSQMVLQTNRFDQQQSQKKILKKLNLNRGVGKMQSFKMVNKFNANDQIQIDYDQFQTTISPLKRISQENEAQIKPKQFFQVQSEEKNVRKVETQFANQMNVQKKYGSPTINLCLQHNYQEYDESKYKEYVRDSDQEQEKSKHERISNEAHSSERQEEQNQQNQGQQKQTQNQQEKITGQSQQQRDNLSAHNFLFYPSDQHLQNGEKLGQSVASTMNAAQILKFLIDPIPPNTIMKFQVIRKRQFLFVDYQFWVVVHEKKIKLMRTASNSINVESTVIHLLLGINNQTKLNLATMNSNFKRQQFYVISNQTKQQKVVAAISTSDKLSITGKPRMQLYTPILSQNKRQFKHINVNKVSNNLRKLKELSSTKNQVNKISSMPVSLNNWQVMSQKHGIRISKRNVLMGENRENLTFFMGKIKNNHYYLTSLSGLSPIQLFSFAVFQLFK